MEWITGILHSYWWPLIIVLLSAWLIQLLYFWVIFARFAFYNAAKRPVNDDLKPVSVIVCAKNEYHNLVRFLPRILTQDYPDYEVIVVNDASDDDTFYLLRELADTYPNLKVVHLPQNLNFFTGKKFPLSIGIKSARYQHVLLTDADCFPAGPDWIKSMQAAYTGNTSVVLGYGAYLSQPGILNRLIRYDTVNIAINYFSFALSGLPYMGVGRNLAYDKQLFFSSGGFVNHYKLASGDDDLFISKVARGNNTRIQPVSDAHTFSKAKQSFSSWLRQKRRHLTTGGYYRFIHKTLLGLYSFSQLLFFVLLVFLAIQGVNWMLLTGIYAIRLFSQLLILKKSMVLLGEKSFLLLSPIFEIILMMTNLVLGFTGLFTKKTQW